MPVGEFLGRGRMERPRLYSFCSQRTGFQKLAARNAARATWTARARGSARRALWATRTVTMRWRSVVTSSLLALTQKAPAPTWATWRGVWLGVLLQPAATCQR